MSKPLSDCSIADMEKLRDALLSALTAQKPDAALRVRQYLPRFEHCSDEEIFEASIGAEDAEDVIAREYGLLDWQALTNHLNDWRPQGPEHGGGGISR